MDQTYFIQADDGGPIKIGRSCDPQSRLSSIQTGNPKKLIILGFTHEEEMSLHRQFQKYRVEGEWFKNSIPLVRWIKDNASLTPDGQRSLIKQIGTTAWEELPKLNIPLEEQVCEQIWEDSDVAMWDLLEEQPECDECLDIGDCECEGCSWSDGVDLLTHTSVVERIGINRDHRILFACCKPLNSYKREREFFKILPAAFWCFDACYWTLNGSVWVPPPRNAVIGVCFSAARKEIELALASA